MFKRLDEILIEIPNVEKPDPNAAAAIQELLGGKFGEMSTLNNYLYQSFNFRSKEKLKPFYDLVMSITAEELGHVELVSHGINKCLRGSTEYKEPDDMTARFRKRCSSVVSLPGRCTRRNAF